MLDLLKDLIVFDKYQILSGRTIKNINIGSSIHDLFYASLGLCAESGEVSNIIKKIARDKDSVVSDEDIQKIKDELGDVLWYITAICTAVGLDLSEVAQYNIEKLEKRYLGRKD